MSAEEKPSAGSTVTKMEYVVSEANSRKLLRTLFRNIPIRKRLRQAAHFVVFVRPKQQDRCRFMIHNVIILPKRLKRNVRHMEFAGSKEKVEFDF